MSFLTAILLIVNGLQMPSMHLSLESSVGFAENSPLLGFCLSCLIDNWDRNANRMVKNDFGVWETVVPAVNGQPAVPHNSKIKVSSIHPPHSLSPFDIIF